MAFISIVAFIVQFITSALLIYMHMRVKELKAENDDLKESNEYWETTAKSSAARLIDLSDRYSDVCKSNRELGATLNRQLPYEKVTTKLTK